MVLYEKGERGKLCWKKRHSKIACVWYIVCELGQKGVDSANCITIIQLSYICFFSIYIVYVIIFFLKDASFFIQCKFFYAYGSYYSVFAFLCAAVIL